MSDAITQGWYAVRCQPHGETRAVLNLERQGFETYFPRYVKHRRHARQLRATIAPFFPRYLFVRLDLANQRWRSVNGTIGVSGLIGPRDCPSRVPDGVIEALRSREDEKGNINLDQQAECWREGDPVRITGQNAFHGCPGLFEGLNDDGRVCVLLDLLGRKVRVTLDIAALEPT